MLPHSGGPIASPNARQAAQYYRRAAQAGQAAATGPRLALRQWLQREADGGDMLAGLTPRFLAMTGIDRRAAGRRGVAGLFGSRRAGWAARRPLLQPGKRTLYQQQFVFAGATP